MNEQILARFLRDLVNTRTQFPYDKLVKLAQYPDHVFSIRIDVEAVEGLGRDRRLLVEAKATTISALPHGTPCSCCNGSGTSS